MVPHFGLGGEGDQSSLILQNPTFFFFSPVFADNLAATLPAPQWLLAWLVAINTSVNSLYSPRTELGRKGAFRQLFLLLLFLSKKKRKAD